MQNVLTYFLEQKTKNNVKLVKEALQEANSREYFKQVFKCLNARILKKKPKWLKYRFYSFNIIISITEHNETRMISTSKQEKFLFYHYKDDYTLSSTEQKSI